MRQKIGSSKISVKFYILSLLMPTQIERNTTKLHHHPIEFTKTYLSKNVILPHRLEGKKNFNEASTSRSIVSLLGLLVFQAHAQTMNQC